MASSQSRLEARVEGRVQGVCFRYYTRQTAHRLELSGWVRNEPDGSVKVVAEGPRSALEELLQFLHKGPEGARVERVQTQWRTFAGDLTAFSVSR